MSTKNNKTHARYYIQFMITLVFTLTTDDRARLSVAGPEMQKELGIRPLKQNISFPRSVGRTSSV